MVLDNDIFRNLEEPEWTMKGSCIYYKGPNNSRVRNNSRGRKNFQNLIIVGTGIIVGGGKCQNVGAGKNAKM